MIIDIHSHILPGIDDGSKNTEMSLSMLKLMKDDGVDICVATPHYYCTERSVESFLKKRTAAHEKLTAAMEGQELPEIRLGAEVYYNPILKNLDNLHDLCIEGTDYLLFELPYKDFGSGVADDISEIITNHHITPIIAHAERFLRFTSYENLCDILEMEVLGQVNCGSLLKFSSRKNASSLIREGYIHLLGTDAHNTDTRGVHMAEAKKIIIRKFGQEYFDTIMRISEDVLANKPLQEIL